MPDGFTMKLDKMAYSVNEHGQLSKVRGVDVSELMYMWFPNRDDRGLSENSPQSISAAYNWVQNISKTKRQT